MSAPKAQHPPEDAHLGMPDITLEELDVLLETREQCLAGACPSPDTSGGSLLSDLRRKFERLVGRPVTDGEWAVMELRARAQAGRKIRRLQKGAWNVALKRLNSR